MDIAKICQDARCYFKISSKLLGYRSKSISGTAPRLLPSISIIHYSYLKARV